jgi:hypothetical protein
MSASTGEGKLAGEDLARLFVQNLWHYAVFALDAQGRVRPSRRRAVAAAGAAS